jgi:hypothetical protein
MSALVERIIAARDRLRPLRMQGEESIRNPAVEATAAMGDAANAIIDLLNTLRSIHVRSRSDGSRTFDDCMHDLGEIDDICRRVLK